MRSSSQELNPGLSIHWMKSILGHKWVLISALGQLRKLRHSTVWWLPQVLCQGRNWGAWATQLPSPRPHCLPPKPWRFASFVY